MAVTSMANSSIVNYNKFNRMDKDAALQAQISGTTGSPTETTDGSARVYQFTGSGSVTVSRAGFVELLVIGGGGAGANWEGGGGGAGAHFHIASAYLPAGTHTVTVGAGGAINNFGDSDGEAGNNGIASRIADFIAPGGGFGGAWSRRLYLDNEVAQFGGNGGSGGGEPGYTTKGPTQNARSGLGISGLGNDGGAGTTGLAGGGGGGAGSAGSNGSGSTGGDGGDGLANSITGTSVTRAGGGAGGGSTGGSGGSGGGGDVNSAGQANTGSGGGSTNDNATGQGPGGSGIVIVRVG